MISTIFLDTCQTMESIFLYIKVRKNTRVRLKTGHILRNLSVIAQRNDFKRWNNSVSYGKRWIAEIVFYLINEFLGVCLFCEI
jgi:hypothetical protein